MSSTARMPNTFEPDDPKVAGRSWTRDTRLDGTPAASAEVAEAKIKGDLAVSATAAREAIRGLAIAAGYAPESLREWSSPPANDHDACQLPPLYYAALLPCDERDEMPLGLGDTPMAARNDLLWTLATARLLEDIATNQSEASPAST